jgi:hypothetical protein
MMKRKLQCIRPAKVLTMRSFVKRHFVDVGLSDRAKAPSAKQGVAA